MVHLMKEMFLKTTSYWSCRYPQNKPKPKSNIHSKVLRSLILFKILYTFAWPSTGAAHWMKPWSLVPIVSPLRPQHLTMLLMSQLKEGLYNNYTFSNHFQHRHHTNHWRSSKMFWGGLGSAAMYGWAMCPGSDKIS